VQVPYRILSEVSVQDITRQREQVCAATDLPSEQSERWSRSTGSECAGRSCAFGSIHTAEVFGIAVDRISER